MRKFMRLRRPFALKTHIQCKGAEPYAAGAAEGTLSLTVGLTKTDLFFAA